MANLHVQIWLKFTKKWIWHNQANIAAGPQEKHLYTVYFFTDWGINIQQQDTGQQDTALQFKYKYRNTTVTERREIKHHYSINPLSMANTVKESKYNMALCIRHKNESFLIKTQAVIRQKK